MKKFRILMLFTALTLLLIPAYSVRSASQSPYELISLINDLRVNNGLSALEEITSLNIAAQMQSDYLANTYGLNFPGGGEGHIGAGGTSELERSITSGYSVGPGWYVDEIWAGGNDSLTAVDAIYDIWVPSSVHYNVMLNADNVHIGAGITERDGFVYYIIVFGIEVGSGGSSSGGVASTVPTTAVTPKVAPVTVATPNEDGSVFHEVETGQALWSIAIAYEVTVDQILALNNLNANAIIYEGQTLMVRPAYTATPEPTATQTPLPSTRTPVPAQTAQAVKTQDPAATENTGGFTGMDRQTMGLALILACGAGLVLIVVGTIAKDKESKSRKSD